MARTGSPHSRSRPVAVRPTAPSWPAAPVTRIDPLSAMRLPSLCAGGEDRTVHDRLRPAGAYGDSFVHRRSLPTACTAHDLCHEGILAPRVRVTILGMLGGQPMFEGGICLAVFSMGAQIIAK